MRHNTVLVRKPKGKRSLTKHRYIWEDTVKMDLKQGVIVWIEFQCLRKGSNGALL